jgi:hypothetical protein
MRNTMLALSIAPISRGAASPIRKPQPYIREKHVLCAGFRTQPRIARTWLSGRATGRRRCFGGRILFFPEQGPVPVERLAVEELNAAMIGLEGAECQTPLAQPKEPDPHFFFAQLIRRATVMRGQTANRIQVKSLGSGRQAGCSHVLDHSHAQRCHGGSPSRVVRRHFAGARKYPQQLRLTMIPPLYGEAVQSNDRLRMDWPSDGFPPIFAFTILLQIRTQRQSVCAMAGVLGLFPLLPYDFEQIVW